MEARRSFADIAAATRSSLSAAEFEVVRFFQENPEEVLVASAAALAASIGTSDATVIRAAQALGFAGLDDLRRKLADDLRMSLSPAARLTRTLGAINNDVGSALDKVVDIHLRALEKLREDISVATFSNAVDLLLNADRIAVFGIGPSNALARYFDIQLRRFGIETIILEHTGLLLADDLQRLRKGDTIILFAYSRVYQEIDSLLARGKKIGASTILLTDTLERALAGRVALVLPVARGNTEWFSTHTATLGLIEALLVGIAAKRAVETVAHLKELNELRSDLAGPKMELPVSHRQPRRKKAKRR